MTSFTKCQNLVDILRWRATDQPEQVGYTFLLDGEQEETHLTYGQLDRQARTIAAQLQALGATGERILLLYPAGLDYVAAFFGCLYAGAVAVPTYPPHLNRPDPRFQSILKDAQPQVLLTNRTTLTKLQRRADNFPGLASLHWLATDTLASDAADTWQHPDIADDTLAFLQYTSGSTSAPKGVMVSHGNIRGNSITIHQRFAHEPDSRTVFWLPMYHDMGLLGGTIQSFCIGSQAILMSPVAFLQKPIRWLQAISRYHATTSGGPNFAYDLCVTHTTPAQRATLDLSSWSLAFNGAEPIRPDTLERFAATFEAHGFRREAFYPCYGMAEATLMISGGSRIAPPVIKTLQSTALESDQVLETSVADEQVRQIVGCGSVVDGHQLVIVNPETGLACEPDQVGEIWVSGPNVGQGYWRRSEETKQIFQAYLTDSGDGPFLRTGDLGFLKDNELFTTGRLKDLIIIRGRNHYPQDIELTVEQSHPALRPSCGAAFSIDTAVGEKLVIVQEIERSYRRNLDVSEVVNAIRQAVSEQHQLDVQAILLLKTATIPKTSSGKIQRRACRARFLADTLDVIGAWSTADRQTTTSELTPTANEEKLELTHTPKLDVIQVWLVDKIAQRANVPATTIDLDAPFTSYGLDSLTVVRLSGELSEWLGRSVSPTLAYDHPSINLLAQHLASQSTTTKPIKTEQQDNTEAIAIVGLGCRFPQADNPEAFWQLLRDGVDAISQVPRDRWDIDALYEGTPATPGKMSTRWGGFLDQVDQFDPHFFGIAPREARSMDPQQRLLLEVSWEALENAGLAPDKLMGSQTGVFIGISSYDYARLNFDYNVDLNAYAGSGNALSIAANRMSYLFDWRGPSWAVDTACSSSLVAVHQACQSLRQGECDLAVAGGVNLILSPESTIAFSQARMMAADGRCKTFDAKANGYVRGEGVGVVILKRLAQALADGDNVLAVIRGSAVNQDGLSNGLTAPNGLAQQAVIRQALHNAGVAPSQISYIEAHGTGTPLGDPTEMNALKQVLMADRPSNQPCLIGSVKTNIGHLEAAAGIAGLIKVVLAVQHGEIPAHLHLSEINPLIDLADTPLSIPTERQPWPLHNGVETEPSSRLAGISAFGFGGTNVHLIVQAPSPDLKLTPNNGKLATNHSSPKLKTQNPKADERTLHLLTLSAKSEPALRQLVDQYQAYLLEHPSAAIADVCFTANTGRSHFRHRLALVAETGQEMQEKLAAWSSNQPVDGLKTGQAVAANRPKIAFLFTGQGSQYIDMAQELYQTQPVFRQTLDRCAQILQPYLEQPLLSIIYPDNENNSDPNAVPEGSGTYRTSHTQGVAVFKEGLKENISLRLNETVYTQTALFAVEYALARMWQSWGIEPDVVLGHSIGEYVAACVAGVFSLEDGLKLVAARGRLMQALPQAGMMVAVFAEEAKVAAAIQPYRESVSIAALNGPKNVVISGDYQAMGAVVNDLQTAGFDTRQLTVSHAFHSPLMEPMLTDFAQVAQEMSYAFPQIDLVSNLTGQPVTDEITTPNYWVQHIREPVRFAQGVTTLDEQGVDIFIEVGPKPILLSLARHSLTTLQNPPSKIAIPTLRPVQSDWRQLLSGLATLYAAGVSVDWDSYDRPYPRRRANLPNYPFQRQRCWYQTSTSPSLKTPQLKGEHPYHALLGQQLALARGQEIRFQSQISYDSPIFLKDHRVFEKVILPATAYLEMALAAGKRVFKSANLMLADVSIDQALRLPEDAVTTIQTVLTPTETDTFTFQIFSAKAGLESNTTSWMLHASGKIEKQTHNQTPESGQLITWQEMCRREVLVNDQYEWYRAQGLGYGSTFQAVTQLWQADTNGINRETASALGRIQLPDTLSRADYGFHPVLLDAGLQVLGAIFNGKESSSTYLPVELERFHVYSQSSDRLWGYAQLRPMTDDASSQKLTADIYLLNEAGDMVVYLEGLLLKQVARSASVEQPPIKLDESLYQIVWQAQPNQREQSPLPQEAGTWLIFSDDSLGRNLAQLFEQQGDDCILVSTGSAYHQIEPKHYQIDPATPQHFQRLLRELAEHTSATYRGVVHLWAAEDSLPLEPSLAQIEQSQVRGCGSALHLAQALAQANWSNSPRLWLVTRGSQAVDYSVATLQVQHATLWGLGRVLTLEQPNLQYTCLDLAPSSDADDAHTLYNELLFADKEDQVAYRQDTRYVPRLNRAVLTSKSPIRLPVATKQLARAKLTEVDEISDSIHLHRDGVNNGVSNGTSNGIHPVSPHADSSYLITGGLGALGLKVAGWLVEQNARHLVLVGRSDPTAAVEAELATLEQAGATVQVFKADVSNRDEIAQVLAEIKRSAPPLHGVVHAAGVLDDGLLLQQSWSRFERVMASKVAGAWNLHTLTQEYTLDFFICFSSMASMLGSPGQANYAAANAFMDTLAHYRHTLGLPALSINWGPWADTGLAAQVGQTQQARWAAAGINRIASADGLQTLSLILNQDMPQIGVFPINWAKFKSPLGSTLLSDFVDQTPIETIQMLKVQFNATSPNEREQLLLAYLQTTISQTLGLSASLLDAHESLINLGLDSLMMVELKHRVQGDWGIDIPTQTLLDGANLVEITQFLNQQLVDAQPIDNTTAVSVETEASASTTVDSVTSQPSEAEISADVYRFELFPEYRNIQQLKQAALMRDAFFKPHETVNNARTVIHGQEFINYASYNYLGLSGHPTVSQAAQAAVEQYGTSVSASRLISGEIPLHRELEQELAGLIGVEDCLIFVGGHATNVTTIGHLLGPRDLILHDELIHNSALQGAVLSGAECQPFPHNDWQAAETMLSQQRQNYRRVLIIIEGVYSMDGDIPDLPQFIALKQRYQALLMVDEAHSIGVLGQHGRGVGEHFGINPTDVDIWMGTLSKSFASCGGYIAGSEALIEYLKYTAPGFVYSVGMSPANTAAALAAIQVLMAEPERVAQVQRQARLFLELAQARGLDTGLSKDSAVVPIILGRSEPCVKLSHALFERGVSVMPIVFPAVPDEAARLRFFISSTHTAEQIRYTVDVMADALWN